MISRDAILKAFPIDAFMRKQGAIVEQKGKEHFCLCPFHADKHPSMRINLEKQVWVCDPCGIGGTVIDLVVRLRNVSVKDAIRGLAEEAGLIDDADALPHKEATYVYKDPYGRNVMFVDRIEAGSKKEFRQYQKDDTGKITQGITGVQRVLYRMERWASKEEVALCEGEKCVHALESIGFDATTNPGGSNGWLDSYALYLRDKHVDIWPDNDKAGNKWLESVLKSLEGKVASLRVLRVPDVYGDVADLIAAQGIEISTKSVMTILLAGQRIERGVMIPLLSAEEAYTIYKARVLAIDKEGIDLSKWLPSFRHYTRILLPGDMAVILSDTGVGKTTILSCIGVSQKPLPGIFFELELPTEALCERFIANQHQVETLDVETTTKTGKEYDLSGWKHIFTCPQSQITIEQMEVIINKAELKIGQRPKFVLVDYIGLMGGAASKRYERLSDIAESLKVLARSTNTVVIVASQISRDKERQEVALHDAKDSGSIENSAQLVIGAWRPAETRIELKILKNTKRAGQHTISCLFDGHKQTIKEVYDEGNRNALQRNLLSKQTGSSVEVFL